MVVSKERRKAIIDLVLQILEQHNHLTHKELRLTVHDVSKTAEDKLLSINYLSSGMLSNYLRQLRDEGKVSYSCKNRIGYWSLR